GERLPEAKQRRLGHRAVGGHLGAVTLVLGGLSIQLLDSREIAKGCRADDHAALTSSAAAARSTNNRWRRESSVISGGKQRPTCGPWITATGLPPKVATTSDAGPACSMSGALMNTARKGAMPSSDTGTSAPNDSPCRP